MARCPYYGGTEPTPTVKGFIEDSCGNPIGEVTLLNNAGNTVANTTTNIGGYYILRFTQPGPYTIRIIPPAGYTTQDADVCMKLKQFETTTANFSLTKQ